MAQETGSPNEEVSNVLAFWKLVLNKTRCEP
jgi:hypothetical protein